MAPSGDKPSSLVGKKQRCVSLTGDTTFGSYWYQQRGSPIDPCLAPALADAGGSPPMTRTRRILAGHGGQVSKCCKDVIFHDFWAGLNRLTVCSAVTFTASIMHCICRAAVEVVGKKGSSRYVVRYDNGGLSL
jgi:hypothetical protein